MNELKKFNPLIRALLLVGAIFLVLLAARNIIVEHHVSNVTIGRLVEGGFIFILLFLLKRDDADKKEDTPE